MIAGFGRHPTQIDEDQLFLGIARCFSDLLGSVCNLTRENKESD